MHCCFGLLISASFIQFINIKLYISRQLLIRASVLNSTQSSKGKERNFSHNQKYDCEFQSATSVAFCTDRNGDYVSRNFAICRCRRPFKNCLQLQIRPKFGILFFKCHLINKKRYHCTSVESWTHFVRNDQIAWIPINTITCWNICGNNLDNLESLRYENVALRNSAHTCLRISWNFIEKQTLGCF